MPMTSRGLEGIVANTTRLSDVIGDKGQLIYNGYDINELVGKVDYKEVVYLLWKGHLPNRSELEDFVNAFARLRADEIVAEKPEKRHGLDKSEAHWRFTEMQRWPEFHCGTAFFWTNCIRRSGMNLMCLSFPRFPRVSQMARSTVILLSSRRQKIRHLRPA